MLILLCGEYKTGKTVSACTFPKPLTLLNFDDGFTSVKHAKDKLGRLVVPDWKEVEVIDFAKNDKVSLVFHTDIKKGAVAPVYTKEAPALVEKLNKNLNSIKEGTQTLVIDSLTSMFRLWKNAILAVNNIPALRIPDYGTLEGALFGQLIPSLKTLNKRIPHIILIDHLNVDKDEITGRIVEYPVGPSVNLGKALGKEFDEIWLMSSGSSSGSYSWKTTKSGFFQAGSRHHLPPEISPATYETLKRYL